MENNAENRKDLAIAQFNSMNMDDLQTFVVENLTALYEKNDVCFQDDWQAYMIPV